MDSAGKRAAFAAFYAPLHFLTVERIVAELGPSRPLELIIDLGCGTGVASAALALSCRAQTLPRLEGVDLHPWALDEARWNWAALGLKGTTRRGSLERRLAALVASRSSLERTAIVCGWSLNELDARVRERAIDAILALAARGAGALVVEPIARKLVPWWDDFATRAQAAGATAHEWRFPPNLPPVLADLDEAAGFDREALSARTVSFLSRVPF